MPLPAAMLPAMGWGYLQVAMTIRLLGEPEIIDAQGLVRPVRGQQVWALLARVLLSRQRLDRRMLAVELFPETADPLGSLRWCLASLRQALGCAITLTGDPVEAVICSTVAVDVRQLEHEDFDVEQAGPLLGSLTPRCSPEFATWLLIERERVAAIVEGRIRQDTVRALAAEDYSRAIRLAELGVRRDPLNEAAHILLTKSLTLAGRQEAALAHVSAAEAYFREELGELPSPALRKAAHRPMAPAPAGIAPENYVNSMLRSGHAAIAAGATDTGVELLRRAVSDAERVHDPRLAATTRLELGTALVHACRGHDGEAAILLQQAATLARQIADRKIESTALRELAYVEVVAGQRKAAEVCLNAAAEAAGDEESLSGIMAFRGFNFLGWGRYEEGLALIGQAQERARAVGNRRQECWALATGAWGLMRHGRLDEAVPRIEQARLLVDAERWVAFRPWVVAVQGEIRLRRGEPAAGMLPELEEAFALACQVDDTSWEAGCAKVIAMIHARLGDYARAQMWLSDAFIRSTRNTRRPTTLQVEVVACKVELAMERGDWQVAEVAAREWIALAARMQMDGHVSKAAGVLERIRQATFPEAGRASPLWGEAV
ncbi:BTAD domain-containing putative transcriptional regulator [Radicibacter daui]|uniref:BTAD domain-containing putative transcriptional regulator n=1 Tax=Radicibacter daui TaxID=3064829 RepID=UPI004046B6B4